MREHPGRPLKEHVKSPKTKAGTKGELWASQAVLVVKNSACQCRRLRDTGSIPWSRRSPAGGPGNPPQYSCLEKPTDRGVWRATVHGVTKSRTRLNRFSRCEGEQGAGLPGGQKRMPGKVMLELGSREEEERPGAGTTVCKGRGACDG